MLERTTLEYVYTVYINNYIYLYSIREGETRNKSYMQQNYSKGNYHTQENYSSVTLNWSEFHASSFFLSPEVKKEKYVLSGYLYLRLWVPPSLLKTKALRSLFQATDSAWLMFFSLIRWLENQLHFPYFPLGRIHAWRPCLKPGKSEVGNRNTDAVCFGVQSVDLVIRLAINQLLLTGVLHRPKNWETSCHHKSTS